MTEQTLHIIQTISKRIAPRYDHLHEAEQATWWMLQALLSTNKAALLARETITLHDLQKQTLDHWIDQLVNEHKPLQYILGTVPYADLTIFVEPPILIPRPETEEWCMALVETWKPVSSEPLQILDLCTGSGCIALTLAKAFKKSHVTATDISTAALHLAEKNATYNDITNITFIQSDLYHDIPDDKQFDIIVANPPYIPFEEWKELDPSVRNWEDQHALMADDEGLYIIKRIIERAPGFLKQDSIVAHKHLPQLALEIGYQQGPATQALMRSNGFASAYIWKDIQGKDRLVTNTTF